MKKEFRLLYGALTVLVLAILTIGATYAYWTATTASATNAVNTESTIYSISMDLLPLYHDFSFIPMDDEDALKALKNECRDKYGRGACSAYTMRVYGYNEKLDYVSGIMNVTTTNMSNLSYMMFREQEVYDENNCADIGGKYYCIAKEAAAVGDGEKLSLGDAYNVLGMTETNFILLIWLTNLDVSQNETDIGSFEASVTIQAGNGGVVTGYIANAVKLNPGTDNNSGSTGTGDITDNTNTGTEDTGGDSTGTKDTSKEEGDVS